MLEDIDVRELAAVRSRCAGAPGKPKGAGMTVHTWVSTSGRRRPRRSSSTTTGAIVAPKVVQMGAVSRAGGPCGDAPLSEAANLDESELAGTSPPGTAAGWCRTWTGPSPRSPATPAASQRCVREPLVIDIGGQDSKAITIDSEGLVDNFAMNDRCASGTGRFFEVLARALECARGTGRSRARGDERPRGEQHVRHVRRDRDHLAAGGRCRPRRHRSVGAPLGGHSHPRPGLAGRQGHSRRDDRWRGP